MYVFIVFRCVIIPLTIVSCSSSEAVINGEQEQLFSISFLRDPHDAIQYRRLPFHYCRRTAPLLEKRKNRNDTSNEKDAENR